MANYIATPDGTLCMPCDATRVRLSAYVNTSPANVSANYVHRWQSDIYFKAGAQNSPSGNDKTLDAAIEVQFTTPASIDIPVAYIKVAFKIAVYNPPIRVPKIRCAICTSDVNGAMYAGTTDSMILDDYQLDWEPDLEAEVHNGNKEFIVRMPLSVVTLQPSTTYWLYIWPGDNFTEYGTKEKINIDLANSYSDIAMTLHTEGGAGCIAYIDDGSDILPYCCHVDNGKGWDICSINLDNGNEFESFIG